MMEVPLTVSMLWERMHTVNGASRVVTLRDPESGGTSDVSFRDVAARSSQLAHALGRLGIVPGDRVASLAWNNQQHFETYLGVMGMGAVLHTMNLRLHPDQLAWTVNHAEDRIIIVDASLVDLISAALPRLPTVEHVIVVTGPGEERSTLAGTLDYEELLAAESMNFPWPSIDERSAASLCYTSGTTGDPKGVLYSHRSIVLHALAMTGVDQYALSRHDRALALVPLFHAMAWGMPFISAVIGNDLILPGPHLKAEHVARFIDRERVTWSSGVPTLWTDVLHFVTSLERGSDNVELSTLRMILCGGTTVPEHLMREFDARFGVSMIQGWGMTEIFPGATVGADEPGPSEDERWSRRRAAGRISPLYQLRVVDSGGKIQPHDGVSVGEIQARGPVVTGAYFRAPRGTEDKFDAGWLRTGDIGTVDSGGWVRITDRAKDAIKSGGEWISSQDLENAIMAHPAVREASVVGIPDERWGERPLAYVVAGAPVSDKEIQAFLGTRVAKWWIPDLYEFIDAIPRTSTGKFDKKVLRAMTGRHS
ncbi:fatty-acid--CoA ligase [Nocardioides marmoriginsengisoli]|uniref:Fatty-acid--CoA ligase n=2 Tax=Nocardioides marmoriginsengisoli TaxID=661483 RepID=A0A3N0CIT0_9ACTN|nr:fatty-acid--CoA ligase [Nocardioides marmoriginsengisoli]